MSKLTLMQRAIALSAQSVANGGGPFGAVVALDGRVIGEGMNHVVRGHDPTAHAEIAAIRAACANIGSHDLAGAEIFSSCEPCPMCLGAIWWSRLSRIHYGNTKSDAAAIGFDDHAFYDELARPISERAIPAEQLCHHEALLVFGHWFNSAQRVRY